MHSFTYICCILLFVIVLFNLSLTQTSPQCVTCCANQRSCSTAYNGKNGRCCGTVSDPWCCAWTDSCVSSTRSCRPSVRRWGALTLGGLIGVIVGSIVGCCLLVTLVVCICKKMC